MSGDACRNGEKDSKENSPVRNAASETTLLSPVNTYFSEEKILIPETGAVSFFFLIQRCTAVLRHVSITIGKGDRPNINPGK